MELGFFLSYGKLSNCKVYTSYYCDYVLQVEEISMQWLSKSKFTFMSNLMNKSPSFLIFQSIFNQWNMDKVYYIYSAMCYFFFL